jgi:hypothetical protein
MNPLIPSWKLFVQFADIGQLFPLFGSIPSLWQAVFTIALLTLSCVSLLLVIYHQLLTIRTISQPSNKRQFTSNKPLPRERREVPVSKRRRRPRWRRYDTRRMRRSW